jgi:hypothetical protein
MLEGLDTFIAFGAVILGASLFVMILVQTVSNVLNLRGRFLQQGLTTLLDTMSPELKSYSEKLARNILKHDLIADGIITKRLAPAIRQTEFLKLLSDEELRNTLLGHVPAAQRAQIVAIIAAKKQRITDWFDTSMDRVSHRFAGWMRIVTVICSFALALGIQLDAFELLRMVSQNAELRARLVSAAGALTEKANDVVDVEGARKSVFVQAVRDVKDEFGELALPDPPAFDTKADAEKWLKERLPEPSQQHRGLDAFESHLRTRVLSSFQSLGKNAALISAELEKSELRLLPDPYIFHLGFDRKLLGILASAGLISLGAPFWFNLLKSAAGLRPIIARNVEKESEAQRAPREKA